MEYTKQNIMVDNEYGYKGLNELSYERRVWRTIQTNQIIENRKKN